MGIINKFVYYWIEGYKLLHVYLTNNTFCFNFTCWLLSFVGLFLDWWASNSYSIDTLTIGGGGGSLCYVILLILILFVNLHFYFINYLRIKLMILREYFKF